MDKNLVKTVANGLDADHATGALVVLAQLEVGDQVEIGGEITSMCQAKTDVSTQKSEIVDSRHAGGGAVGEPPKMS